MKLKLTNDEVQLLIDVLKGEAGRLRQHRKTDERSGEWVDRRIVFVDALTDRLKAMQP